MTVLTVNGRTYTKKFAWLPVRTQGKELVWFTCYYLRPDRNGVGVVLSFDDFVLECS